jgi:hypothetical protein
MKSRLALFSLLVAAMVLGTAGAAFAVGGSSTDASVAQYGTPTPTPTSTGGNVLGEQAGGGSGGGQVAGAGTQGAVQPARQVEAGVRSASLPFTGFLAIPVLLIGGALLSVGLLLRRRAADDRD